MKLSLSRYGPVFLVILVLSSAAIGQEPLDAGDLVPCVVSSAELPPVRDIRLGMSKKEFQGLFERKVGDRVSREVFRDIASFQQVHSIGVDFLKDSLVRFDVTYDNRLVAYKHLQAFTRNLSDSLGISNRSWRFHNEAGHVVCSDFEVRTVMLPIGPRVTVAKFGRTSSAPKRRKPGVAKPASKT